MRDETTTIRIAAALVDDPLGRLLLVRKAGTTTFMQAGGKIEPGETASTALRREMSEEVGFEPLEEEMRFIGTFSAVAANEADCLVEAHLFHVRMTHEPVVAAEIAEAAWVYPTDARNLSLAPLTRDHVLPLAAAIVNDH
jgi:8-oxo-dGTP diphosphatase